jgi:hypothetical protein
LKEKNDDLIAIIRKNDKEIEILKQDNTRLRSWRRFIPFYSGSL